jgi:hypothetical protein
MYLGAYGPVFRYNWPSVRLYGCISVYKWLCLHVQVAMYPHAHGRVSRRICSYTLEYSASSIPYEELHKLQCPHFPLPILR